jgi:alpha-glucosidase
MKRRFTTRNTNINICTDPISFVAPVVKKGRKRRSLYLPEDKWIHLWSGAEYGGGSLTVEAPIGMPPVFYRKDTPWIDLFRGLKEC